MKFNRCKFFVQHHYMNEVSIEQVTGWSFTYGEDYQKRTLYTYKDSKYWHVVNPDTGLTFDTNPLATTRRDAVKVVEDRDKWAWYVKYTALYGENWKSFDKAREEFQKLCKEWETRHEPDVQGFEMQF